MFSLFTKKEGKDKKDVKYPCRRCFYYHACGDGARTKPCPLRITRKDAKKAGMADIV